MRTRTYYVLKHKMIEQYVKVNPSDITECVGLLSEATPFPSLAEIFSLIARRARKFAGADLGFEVQRVTMEIQEVPKLVSIEIVK